MSISVIAALDVFNGQVVRLKQGSFENVITYEKNIQDTAAEFLELGIRHVQLIDVYAAKNGKFTAQSMIRELSQFGMQIQYGGGIRSLADAKMCFEAGAHRIITGTAAIKNPKLLQEFIATYGANRVILAVDTDGDQVAICGWTDTAELVLENVLEFASQHSVRQILMTDISRDGMRQGVYAPFYGSLVNRYPQINFIAAGGVTTPNDIIQLRQHNVHQVVVGRALYEDLNFCLWLKKNLHGCGGIYDSQM